MSNGLLLSEIYDDVAEQVDLIDAFSDECERGEYTDTGEAWFLFRKLQKNLNALNKDIKAEAERRGEPFDG